MSSDEEDAADDTIDNPNEVEPSTAETIDPRETDVLCGRGGAALRHPGNQTYRRLVNLNKGLYTTCLKTEKLKISRSIVAAIREQNGRFLERDAKKGTWYDIGDKKAIEKTSQALREGQPKLRAKMVELGHIAPDQGVNNVQQQYGNGIYSPRHTPSLGSIGSGGSGGYPMSNPYGMLHHSMGNGLSEMPPPPSRTMSGEMNSEMTMMQRLSLTSIPQSIPSWTPSVTSMGTAMEEAQARSVARNHYRPSLSHRGSNVAHELAMQSNHTMMSDYSSFGPSDRNLDLEYHVNEVGSMDFRQQQQYHQQQLLLHQHQRPLSNGFITGTGGGSGSTGGTGMGVGSQPAPPPPPPPPAMSPLMSPMMDASPAGSRFDRRRLFAKMKYSQTTSNRNNQHSQHSIGDGMPDIHMVDSQYSLLSNLSGHGSRHHVVTRDMDFSSHGVPVGGGEAKESIGSEFIGVGSRRSLMSGLSRMSGHSDVNNPFSDMSKKIGSTNISSRSIAMSEISGIEEGFAEDMDEFNFDLPPPRGGSAT
jgi:hypothetical protein